MLTPVKVFLSFFDGLVFGTIFPSTLRAGPVFSYGGSSLTSPGRAAAEPIDDRTPGKDQKQITAGHYGETLDSLFRGPWM